MRDRSSEIDRGPANRLKSLGPVAFGRQCARRLLQSGPGFGQVAPPL